MNKSLIVSLLLLTIQWTGINASLRSGSEEHDVSMSGNVHHHHESRELWGTGRQWSFSNLLFHIGICSADASCVDKPRPGPLGCGCPDCSKPHPPHFQHNYCENLNSTTTEAEAEAAVDSSANNEANVNGTQTATSIFNPIALMAAAAVMAFLIAGIIMQKRRQNESADERAIPLDGDKDENNSMSGISTAFAAVMTKMGLKAGDKTDNDYDDMDDNGSVHSVKNAVLNRQSLAASGVAVPPVYQMESTPSFIPIPQDPTNPYVSQTREGLEVGGYRPSSVRNSSDFRASTPYAV